MEGGERQLFGFFFTKVDELVKSGQIFFFYWYSFVHLYNTVHFQDNAVFYIMDSDLTRGVRLVHCFPVQVYIAYVCVYESDTTQKHESNPNPNDLICPVGTVVAQTKYQ